MLTTYNQHIRTILLLWIFFSFHYTYAQWNPNAGLIPSLTKKARIIVSSGNNANFLTDNNPNTYWESESPLPTRYLRNKQLNLLLNNDSFSISPSITIPLAFDGNTDTKSTIGNKSVSIKLSQPENISWATIKINTPDSVTVTIISNTKQTSFNFKKEKNYQILSFELKSGDPISEIILTSDSPYELFEFGILYSQPEEYIELDFTEPTTIGWISTRHFNGDGINQIELLSSKNGQNWTPIAMLNPQATAMIPTLIQPEIKTRFIRIVFTLQPRPYQKAKLMEIAVYDHFGPFGAPKKANPAYKSFAESMGINSFWGWGYNVYSDLLNENQGPNLFIDIVKLVRNYHRIDWDIANPQQITHFAEKEYQTGNSGSQWMNWEREYANWKKAGYTIDAAITFDKTTFSDKAWKNTQKEAFDYGRSFAEYFVNKKKLISSIEIGNEPWDYDGETYRKVLAGMSSGIKSTASRTKVLPCAVQAFDPGLDLNNYIAKYITASETKHLDGLNTHIYSYCFDSDGKRRAINPEDPRSEVWSMNNLIRFRDANMPGKVVVVTEFGFDSEGAGENCTHDECISEMEQALFGTRMALILYRLGAESMYWYYFANVDWQSMLHNRSGLTASYSGGFTPKLSFNAFKKLQEQLGEYFFYDVILENEQVYAYAFADRQGNIKKLVAWRPTSDNHAQSDWIDIPWKTSKIRAEYLISTESDIQQTPPYSLQINGIRIGLTGNPVIITLNE